MIKKILLLSLFMSIALCFVGQNANNYRQIIETNSVPKKVRAEFNTRYPGVFVKMWYVTSITYWYQDYGPSYYNGWYQPRNVVVYNFSEPANYEVEFLSGYDNSRAIFNRYGVWFETRTKVVYLPELVESALAKSEYGSWKRSEYMERIEAPGMPGSVYRMQVSNKHLSQIIRINDTGSIIQIKSE
jgi:hypothetical protein